MQRHPHRALVGFLLLAATVVGVAAVLAVWVNRQALNTENVTSTSLQILANKQVRTALSAYLVQELFNSVDVRAELRRVLPAQLRGDAGRLASDLRRQATRAAPQLLARPQVQDAFKQALRAAHTTFLRITTGGGSVISTRGGVVTLDLHRLVDQLAASLGVSSQLAAAESTLRRAAGASPAAVRQKLELVLAPASGRLVILRSSQLKVAQDVVSAVKALALALPLIAVAIFALAIWLAGGWRRVALRTTGLCLVGIGLLVLLVRRVAGNEVVDSLVKLDSTKPAAHQVWTIGTSMLYDLAAAMIVLGLILAIATSVAGLLAATRRRRDEVPNDEFAAESALI